MTSISCDTHKYGYAPKGTSVIMFRSREYRDQCIYAQFDWTGGIYATASMAGSRNGSLIIGCWASMLKNGKDGYFQKSKLILDASHNVRKEMAEIPEIRLLTQHNGPVVAFTTEGGIHPIALADHLHTKGWALNKTMHPPGFHVAITHANYNQMPKLVKDTKASIEELRKNPELNHSSDVALYCTAAKIPDKNMLSMFVKTMISENLEVHEKKSS